MRVPSELPIEIITHFYQDNSGNLISELSYKSTEEAEEDFEASFSIPALGTAEERTTAFYLHSIRQQFDGGKNWDVTIVRFD
jgi:hypothetical protein